MGVRHCKARLVEGEAQRFIKGLPSFHLVGRYVIHEQGIEGKLDIARAAEALRVNKDHSHVDSPAAQRGNRWQPFHPRRGGDDGQRIEPAQVRLRVIDEALDRKSVV